MDWVHLFTGFKGRINRRQWWAGLVVLALLAAFQMSFLRQFTGDPVIHKLLSVLFIFCWVFVDAALAKKRLNDRNRPTWLFYLYVTFSFLGSMDSPLSVFAELPGISNLWPLFIFVSIWRLIELGFLKGTVGANPHGSDPCVQGGHNAAIAGDLITSRLRQSYTPMNAAHIGAYAQTNAGSVDQTGLSTDLPPPLVSKLLNWAWPLLALGLILNLAAPQLMFRLDDWDIPNRVAFLLGRFIGELPIIAICGVVVLAFLRITSVPTINLRTLAIALAFGSVLDALVIYPIVIATSA